ncbi:MAG TPA: exonuclease domain-containing protein, partial [Gaiellaceae bacterium]|nr:exonuclease domain-containing protein [Gaiellaceae bacterium]
MTGERDLLLAVLAGEPDGLTRPTLLARLRDRIPYLQPADVERVLTAAADAVRVEGERIFARAPASTDNPQPMRLSLPCRFVVFDLESVVRPIVREPYREQHVFQIGAVRFGPEHEWASARREFSAFTALPTADDELLIYRDELRQRYQRAKRPLAEVLEEFRSFCAGADAVVAYNGVAHDFRLLEEEYARCGLPPLLSGGGAPRLVDGLYLAHALWPIPPRQHRLKELLERLEIDVEEMHWHDALDDSKMVVELLEYGARELLPSFGPDLARLLASAGRGSDAWELLFALASEEPEAERFDHARAAGVLLGALEGKASKEPLRPEPPPKPAEEEEREEPKPPEPIPIRIPQPLRGDDGRISLDRLVAAVKGAGAEAREAQRVMVARLRDFIEQGATALVEAPTGTGKSYALLAAALDWLAADDRNKVVISTFTKQLQSQLAADIEALTEAAMPDLVKAADMVKGAANRLSLRALV